jgi:hypothetical protein
MESAERVPSPGKSNKDIIARFRDEYNAALADAEVSANHTVTEGWRRMYSDRRQKSRAKRAEAAKRLRFLVDRLEDFGWMEEDEKSTKDIVKESTELRATEDAWQREVVDRVCEPIGRCDKIRIDYENQAHREEQLAPLHNIGLEQMMKSETRKQRRPRFDHETGQVFIDEPHA